MSSNEVRRLFEIAVGLSAAERGPLLNDPAVPADVRADVESLLSFDADPGHRLTAAVAGAAADLIEDGGTGDRTGAGTDAVQWGHYRYIRLLGTGGMSAVYLAERTDGEVQQRVAVKVLNQRAGRPASLERFLQERQLLANMNHPGIARLLDAGRTPEGQPYLVMEFVDGVRVDDHAAALDVGDKLRLFVRICDAVSYAHRHLVIHRDIKPANILVDASSQPKLLDFGIAKLLDSSADQTHPLDRWLTPDYASPEQRRGQADTTATDVYSLGAVLHTMLIGRPPSESDVQSAGLGDTADVPADARYILRKALRAEPTERYASVDAMASDVQALLEWRPVEARADDRWYRMRRFLRRHRTAAALVVLLVTSLSAGLFVVNRERALADRRFQQVRRLANQVIALDMAVREVPGATKARQAIVAISKEYLEALAGEAGDDPMLSFELGSAYLSLARAQGMPTQPNLGMQEEAGRSLNSAEALMQTVVRASPSHRLARLALGEINHDLMILADTDHRQETALSRAREATTHLEMFLGATAASASERKTVAGLFNNVALFHKNLHRYEDCVRIARRATDVLGPNEEPEVRSNLLSLIADSLRLSGDLSGALQAITEARQIVAPMSTETTRSAINRYNVLWREGVILGGDGQINLERPEEAVEALQRAFDLLEAMAAKDPSDALGRIRLSTTVRELGAIVGHDQPERALATYDHALRRLGEVENNVRARRGEAQVLAASSYVLRRMDRVADARGRIDQALQILRDTKTYPAEIVTLGTESETVLRAWADHLADTGDSEAAAHAYQELLDKVKASHPDPQNDLGHATSLSRLYEELSRLQRRLNHPGPAESLRTARIEIWRSWNQRLPQNPYVDKQLRLASLE